MHPSDFLTRLRRLRQSRSFTGQQVDVSTLNAILDVARWTGSSKKSQPWQLIVVTDGELLRTLSTIRPANAWLADAGLAIAVVTSSETNQWDEGRLSERLMLAADALGLGSGTAWFSTPEHIRDAKHVLGIPDDMHFRQLVVIGHTADTDAKSGSGGRKPLEEIVSYNRLGERSPSGSTPSTPASSPCLECSGDTQRRPDW